MAISLSPAEAMESAPQKTRSYTSVGLERHEDDTIIIPAEMTVRDGAKWLDSIADEQEEPYEILVQTEYHPLDGAYALSKALARTFGNARSVVVPPTFFSAAQPPTFIDVPLDAGGSSVQVPWGRFVLPGADPNENYLEAGMTLQEGRPVFVLRGTMQKKFQYKVDELSITLKEILDTESIYRNQAIRVDKMTYTPEEVESRQANPTKLAPKFINVSGFSMNNIILNRTVEQQIEALVLAPIRYPELCAEQGITRKRGVLLWGTYGVGKSIASSIVAAEATSAAEPMTFIYLEDARQFEAGYRMAMQYSPAVLFVEDVDKVMSGERDSHMDRLLNLLDGIESKQREVTVIFTTNELLNIHQAFNRPGRVDAIIHFEEPDAESAARLVQMYAGAALDSGADLERIGAALAGNIPALIAEAVKRAKLAAIARNDGERVLINHEDIEVASASLDTTRKLLEHSTEVPTSVAEQMGRASMTVLEATVSNGVAAR